MLLRRFPIVCLVVCAVFLLAVLVIAAPQDAVDRDAYARDHVRFLVVQLDQWSKELPQQFYTAVMKPPVDATKLSEAAKASAGELGDSLHKLASLAGAKDLLTNAQFRDQLDKALGSAKELNVAITSQRFPTSLQSNWDQVRSTLNNLARVYKLETLAFLEPPAGGGGGGRGGRGAAAAGAQVAAAGPGGGVTGYIVDLMCAKRGKGMWTNVQCIERCLRDGDKLVLVTEEGKVYQISNQDKITPETYGQVVTLMGKTEGESITVDSIKL
jgi:hypothetical protein